MSTPPAPTFLIEPKPSTLTPEQAELATEAGMAKMRSMGVDVNRITQEVTEQLIYKAIEPHEHLWDFAKGTMRERLFESQRSTVRAALAVLPDGKWPTLDECIPPGSILNDIDAMFYKGTNFPRELPFFATLHYFSALLLQHDCRIELPAHLEVGLTLPDLWSVALAESGSGKSATMEVISGIFGKSVRMFPDPGSASKFVDLLAEHNGALWERDEFGQFIKKLESGPWEEGKDYLLRTATHAKIERNTKKDGNLSIDEAKLVVYGATVPETIKQHLSFNAIVDGFSQRFAWIFANKDARKPPPTPSYPGRTAVIQRWKQMAEAMTLHKVFRVDDAAYNAYTEAFEMMMSRCVTESIPDSYSGRLTRRAIKYAAIFHVLLGKNTDRIDSEDMIYAARIVTMNLRDIRKLLDLFSLSAYGEVAQRAKDRVLTGARKKVKIDARTLQQDVRGLNSIERAWQMIEYLADDPECQPHLIMEVPRSLRKKLGFTGKAILTR